MRFCDLPDCRRPVAYDQGQYVRVVVDGRLLVGVACCSSHADELRRGWSTRDAFGALFLTPGRALASA